MKQVCYKSVMFKFLQQSFPMRHKEIHVLNIPQVFKYVYDFCLGLVSNKIKKRVLVSNVE